MKDNKTSAHISLGLHTISKNFFNSGYLGQLKQARAFPASKSLMLTQALGAVPAHIKWRKSSSILPHTTLPTEGGGNEGASVNMNLLVAIEKVGEGSTHW